MPSSSRIDPPGSVHSPVKMNASALSMIEDINTRQDDALNQLDELNKRIEALVDLCVSTAKVESDEANEMTATDEANIATESDSSQDAIVEVHAPEKRAA